MLRQFPYLFGYLLCYLFAFGTMNTVSIVLADTGAKGGWQAAAKQYALGGLIGAGGYTIILIAYYAILKTTHYPPFFLPYPPPLPQGARTRWSSV